MSKAVMVPSYMYIVGCGVRHCVPRSRPVRSAKRHLCSFGVWLCDIRHTTRWNATLQKFSVANLNIQLSIKLGNRLVEFGSPIK